MKAEDLMIGDWVRLKDDSLSYEESCMKITFLSNSTMCSLRYKRTNTPIGLRKPNENWLCPVFADDIEPIPLTPEILEKNGFKIEFYNEYKVYELNNFKVCKNCCDYFEVCDFWDDSDWGWKMINFCLCIYVHELQHALKLCGIDKEIVV